MADRGDHIVDSHHHVWDVAEHDQPWLASQPELAPLLRRFDMAGLAPLAAGSDWPVSTLTASYGQVLAAAQALTAGLAPAERAAIFSTTARRAYRLPS